MTATDFLRISSELGIFIAPVSALMMLIMQVVSAGLSPLRQWSGVILTWQIAAAVITLPSGGWKVALHNAPFFITPSAIGGILGLSLARAGLLVARKL